MLSQIYRPVSVHVFFDFFSIRYLFRYEPCYLQPGNVLAILSFPIVGGDYIFNALRVVWADLFYGIAIGVGIPSLILG